MRIGVPKEIKPGEYRVGLVPGSVDELAKRGHQVSVETNAGVGIGASDQDYRAAGAIISATAEEVFSNAELIIKVKEPQASEYPLFTEQHVLFTYLHLAADRELTDALLSSGTTAIAYETVTDSNGGLPLLRPMSEVAGRLSIQAGAYALQKHNGGSGILLGGVAGVGAGEVVVLGGGVVGSNAIQMALGAHARVTVLDRSLSRLSELDLLFNGQVNTVYSTHESVAQWTSRADLTIGAVLIPGAAAPKLISKAMLKNLKAGSVLVDVAIDQGGCFETSRPTTHEQPSYVIDDIVHYCVANIPGAVPRTSAYALNNATLPYVVSLADTGCCRALKENPGFLDGLNVYAGRITQNAVAEAFGATGYSGRELLKAA